MADKGLFVEIMKRTTGPQHAISVGGDEVADLYWRGEPDFCWQVWFEFECGFTVQELRAIADAVEKLKPPAQSGHAKGVGDQSIRDAQG